MKLTTARLWRRGAITAIAGASALALTACGGGGGSTAGTDSLSLFVNVENTDCLLYTSPSPRD